MRRPILRSLPALVVLALFALAAQSSREARLQAAPLMPVPVPVTCTSLAEAATGDSLAPYPDGASVAQPLSPGVVVEACSLAVNGGGWTNLQFELRSWDPVTLAPDPTDIALRLVSLNPSALQYYTINRAPRVGISPPLISRSIPGVADPPRETVAAMMLSVSSLTGDASGLYSPAGDGSLQAARVVSGTSTFPLPGAHPVLAHSVCSPGGDAEQARVTQAVSRVDAVLTRTDEFLQYFRVPARAQLCWLEFAILGYDPATYQRAPLVQILDVTTAPTPGDGVPAGLVSSPFRVNYFTFYGGRTSLWAAADAFDHAMVFEPGHLYALRLSHTRGYDHYSRVLTGSESPAFQYGVGSLYAKDSLSTEWVQQPGRALSFKLVAIPVDVVGGPRPAPAAFALHVAPNPARDAAEVSWSGAVGPVRLDVLDARGRRVATGSGGAAGRWQWAQKRGDALPAGVYFVRARDSEGGVVTERLVVIR